jgi:hypothetical protein
LERKYGDLDREIGPNEFFIKEIEARDGPASTLVTYKSLPPGALVDLFPGGPRRISGKVLTEKATGGSKIMDLANMDEPLVQNYGGRPSPKAAVNPGELGHLYEGHVYNKKIKSLDDRGHISEENVLSPFYKKRGAKPDWIIYDRTGESIALADAKVGRIAFDAQAKDFVIGAAAFRARTLIYYTPTGKTRIPKKLIDFASEHGVKVRQIKIPW